VLYTITPILTFVSVILVLMVSLTLWNGASEAIRVAGVKRRLPGVRAGAMARPLHLVLTGTPLAEALRQRDEALLGRPADGAGGVLPPRAASVDPRTDDTLAIGVSDSAGRVIALVNGLAAERVPINRRPWVDVDSVSRSVAPSQRIPADAAGMAVLEAVQANPGNDLLVTVGEDVVGVLRVRDVIAMLEARGPHE
jgi:hypothetical protein